jgi:hypothetical protein
MIYENLKGNWGQKDQHVQDYLNRIFRYRSVFMRMPNYEPIPIHLMINA